MSVRVTVLDNGLRVATDAMASVESVSLGLWVGAGTRDEHAEIMGVSHLLEHMAFKGTKRRSARAIAEEIEAVGGHLNAYTSRENTAFYAKVLKDDVPVALDILADIMQRSVFDPEELRREQAVVLQEIGQAVDTPDDIIFDHLQAIAYPDQPLGWPVLGTAETVRGLTRDALIGYMARQYSAGGMVLAAAGRVDHDRLVEQAARLFGDLPRHAAPVGTPARYGGGEFREARDLEQVHLTLAFAGVAYGDPDYYAASVLSALFGGGMSSRLFQEIREKRGLVYTVYSFSGSYRDGGLFGIYAGTGEDEVAELMPVLCDEIGKMTESVGEAELARAAAQLKSGLLMALESTTSRCEALAQQLLVFGRPLSVEEVVAAVDAVDPAAVLRVAGRVFRSAPSLAVLGPIERVDPLAALRGRLPS